MCIVVYYKNIHALMHELQAFVMFYVCTNIKAVVAVYL